MAARYWRITGIETYGGGDLELSELQLFALDANNNPVRVDQTATLTSSVPPIAGTLSALNDGDTSTTARFPTGPGLAFVWDFGDGGGYDITHLFVAAPQKSASIYGATLQYSNDGVAYSTVIQLRGINHSSGGVLVSVTNNAQLLMPFDTDFLDKSLNQYTTTAFGNVTLKSDRYVSGGKSAYFGGDGDYLVVNGDLPTKIHQTPMTLDCWCWVPQNLITPSGAYNGFVAAPIISQNLTYALGEQFIGINSSKQLFVTLQSGVYNGSEIAIASVVLPSEQWVHLEVTLTGSSLLVFLNGTKVYSQGYSFLWTNNGQTFNIGKFSVDDFSYFNGYWNGYIDNLRITQGVLHTDNFTPPTYLPLPQWITAHPVYAQAASPMMITGADVPPFTTATASPPISIDIIDGGTGRLTGTVREKTGISTRPLQRRVVLLDYRSNRKLRETWSDPATGVYTFDEIDLNREYTVISLDHTGQYRAVIADNLVPEKML